MSLFNIKYDLKKDLDNYDYSFIKRRFPSYGRADFDTAPYLWPDIKKSVLEADESDKLKIIKKYLLKNFSNKEVMSLCIDTVNNYWSGIESDYIDKLCKYMGVAQKIPSINVYITTLSICPYNTKENYFYIPFFASFVVQAKIIMHEFMHIIFRHNYEKYLSSKGVDNQGILEITEALTILLNWEFREFMLIPEYNNKPTSQDLQKEVVVLYEKKKSFKDILDRLIELRVS